VICEKNQDVNWAATIIHNKFHEQFHHNFSWNPNLSRFFLCDLDLHVPFSDLCHIPTGSKFLAKMLCVPLSSLSSCTAMFCGTNIEQLLLHLFHLFQHLCQQGRCLWWDKKITTAWLQKRNLTIASQRIFLSIRLQHSPTSSSNEHHLRRHRSTNKLIFGPILHGKVILHCEFALVDFPHLGGATIVFQVDVQSCVDVGIALRLTNCNTAHGIHNHH